VQIKKLSDADFQLAKQYSPIMHFDEREPFYPVRIGVTVLEPNSSSPSFNRRFEQLDSQVEYVIEYAIYWDYDIEHLYDLEHIWVYVAKDGRVADCEASFHGYYFKGVFKSHDTIEGKRVHLYSQPGKHAFMPDPRVFELIPDYDTCTYETAGSAGLIVTSAFKGIYSTSELINRNVEAYLQRFRFRPSGVYQPYALQDELFVSWEELRHEVPERIQRELIKINEALQ
jgi:hypothetical protein